MVQNSNASFDGTLQINGGIVELRHAEALGDSTNRGRITLNSGALSLRNDASTNFANAVTVMANSTLNVDRLTGTGPAVTHTIGALSIGGNTLTMTGGNGSSLVVGATALTGNATFHLTSADVALGPVSGAFGLTKSGSGTLTLNGTSTFTGLATIASGTLGVASANALSGGVSVASGAVFDTTNVNQSIASLAGAGSVTIGNATLSIGVTNSSSVFSGILSGTGNLVKLGLGTLQLSGANTYAGASTVSAGTLQLGAANSIPVGSAMTVSAGATFDLNGFSSSAASVAGTGGITLGGGTLSIGAGNSSSTFAASISGAGTFVKAGTGALTFSGASTHTGATNVAAGALLLQNTSALGSTAAGTIVSSGAEIQLAGGMVIGAESLTLNGSGATGSGALRNTAGVNAWSGAITLASDAVVSSAAGTLTLSGAIDKNAGSLTFAGAGNTSVTGVISGASSTGLAKTGSGTLTLAAANSFSGVTSIDSGKLVAQAEDAFGASGMAHGTVVASGATLELSDAMGLAWAAESLTLSGAGLAGVGALSNAAGVNSWGGDILFAADSTVGVTAGSLTLLGAGTESGGARAVTKAGAGTLTLAGMNSYTGATCGHLDDCVGGPHRQQLCRRRRERRAF